MPSSTSSSDPYSYEDRPIPERPWRKALALGIILMIAAVAGWEYNARAIWGYETGYYIDSYGLWSKERKRVDKGEAEVAIIGASRAFFNLDLNTYEDMTGTRPVMLAMVGTNPRPFLTDLANDEDFKGLLIIGITPGSFFRHEHGLFADVIQYHYEESPSQWMGQRLSMLLEPHFAFYDNSNWPLFTLLERSGLENPEGVRPPGFPVWKISQSDKDRNTKMFWKTEELEYYQHYNQMTWRRFNEGADARGIPPFDIDTYLAEVVEEIEKIRARGGDVVFVRSPSSGDYRPREARLQPRETHWDRLLRDTNSVGVHFEDHEDLRHLRTPEWSHLHSEDTFPFTAGVIRVLDARLKAQGKEGLIKE